MKCYNLMVTSQRFTYEIMFNDAFVFVRLVKSMNLLDLTTSCEKAIYKSILESLIRLARDLKY